MIKQYWVGEFFVDLSRNQVRLKDQIYNLPPKALQVLTYLAENSGSVVEYDELLSAVWPNSVVTPNTLQRSIAQLRKVFSETLGAQEIIKTHAKQGYSLECEIVWQETQPTNFDNNNTESKTRSEPEQVKDEIKPSIHYSKLLLWLALVPVVLVAAIFLPVYSKKTPQIQLGDFRYITASDDKEYGARYSPDGKYILFHRYYDTTCINDIWAKNTETLEEVQLTKERGTYSGFSLSPDGKTLAFVQQEDCTKPITQLDCYKLMSLDFNQALVQPQKADEILHCENSAIKSPAWIDNQSIALLQTVGQSWQLIRYSLSDKSSAIIHSADEGNIFGYAFSFERQLFAVVSFNQRGQKKIEMLSSEGEIISSHGIRKPDGASRHLQIYPNFIPNSDQLIFSSYGRLYALSQKGEVSEIKYHFDRTVGAPSVHPNSDRLLLITGQYDSDIARAEFADARNESKDSKESKAGAYPAKVNFSVFERSIESEYHAKFQPNGSAIAFASERTGSEQVWVLENGRAKTISQFEKGTHIQNLHWSADGREVLTLAGDELHLLSLDKAPITSDFSFPVASLFHWDSEKEVALANILVNGNNTFVEIDLHANSHKVINNSEVIWAANSDSGNLVFQDHMNRLWKKGAVEDELIEPLQSQVSSKRFIFDGEVLYGVNKSNQLWSFNLQTADFNLVASFDRDFSYITDINEKELLLTFVVDAKKEVIEFEVGQ